MNRFEQKVNAIANEIDSSASSLKYSWKVQRNRAMQAQRNAENAQLVVVHRTEQETISAAKRTSNNIFSLVSTLYENPRDIEVIDAIESRITAHARSYNAIHDLLMTLHSIKHEITFWGEEVNIEQTLIDLIAHLPAEGDVYRALKKAFNS